MTDVRIIDVAVLDAMRARMRASPERVEQATQRAEAAAEAAVEAAARRVVECRRALEQCAPEDRGRREAALRAAEANLGRARDALAHVRSVARSVRATAREMCAAAVAELARIAERARAIDAPAEITAAAGVAGDRGSHGGGASGGGTRGGSSASTGRSPGSLPPETPLVEFDALRWYSGLTTSYSSRARLGGLTAADEAHARNIDSAFARVEPLREDTDYERLVGADFFDSLAPGSGGGVDLVRRLDDSVALEDPGFVSTSAPGGSYEDKAVHLRIHVPAGTPVIDMTARHPDGAPISRFDREREMLLPRGGYLVASPEGARFDPASGHYFVDVTYLRL